MKTNHFLLLLATSFLFYFTAVEIISNDQFPGNESFPQMNGIGPKKEPQYPGSESFGPVKENYPKGIMPSVPTKMTNSGRPFINTLGGSTPEKYTNSENYYGDESYRKFRETKQYPILKDRRVQFPGTHSFPGNEKFNPHMSMENDIEVDAGGYESPYLIQQQKEKERLEQEKQRQLELKKQKKYIKQEPSSKNQDSEENEGEI